MKVLVVTNMYPTEKAPFYGIFVKEQVESLRKEGVNVDVFFINGQENKWNYFISIIALLKKLKPDNYDVIHSHHTYCIFPIIIAKKILRIKKPIILTFHEGEVHHTNVIKPRGIKRLVFSKNIKRMALRMVDMVITVQKELVEALNYSGQYTILPCGVDSDLFTPMEKVFCRKELNLPLNKKIVFFPAAPQNIQKGIIILKKALAFLDRNDLELLTAGNIPHKEMPYYMNAADVIVQLSNFEASPMALKEAMAVNVPVVFTDAGDAALTVGNTQGCFLCKRTPEDVVLKLEEALNINGSINSRARILEAGMTLEAVAKKNIETYCELLNCEK